MSAPKCYRCGAILGSGDDNSGLCRSCQLKPMTIEFKYKCKCGGCFNEPAYRMQTGTLGTMGAYYCPFCGLKMEGLI